MSVKDFDDGYFYMSELKDFARATGIAVGNRRKIELEEAIREYLSSGAVSGHAPRRNRIAGQPRDALTPDSVVKNYVDDRQTKDFLLTLVLAEHPGLTNKSGQWYWLNDWRRNQLAAGRTLRYAQLSRQLRTLMETPGRLPQIPSARMNNFITDFRASPGGADTPHDEVMSAWQWLKKQACPKTFADYQRLKRSP